MDADHRPDFSAVTTAVTIFGSTPGGIRTDAPPIQISMAPDY
jgi:hypothetical protein